MDLYEKREGEYPVEWVSRVVQTVAIRGLVFSIGLFVLVYLSVGV